MTLRTALVEMCYPTRCAHVICPHRRGEVVERSPAGTNVRLGSTTDLTALKPDFRFTPESRLRADIAPCPVRANNGSRGPYSITSSARASSDGGTVSPSALAVLRLTTSSYLVGACTGRSAGFSPLRIRST